ncbi:HEAT repeat domain-containing protein [Streptomyces albus]|nr:HEAT repeat domain-containing protein [Streptomyces albus]
MLEEELGRTASYEELSVRALRRGEPWHDDWREPVRVLGARGDEETYAAAAARLGEAADSPEALFAVEVLGRLGVGRLTPRVVPLLRELAREAVDAQLLAAVVRGLGHHGDPGALPELYEAVATPRRRSARRRPGPCSAWSPPTTRWASRPWWRCRRTPGRGSASGR